MIKKKKEILHTKLGDLKFQIEKFVRYMEILKNLKNYDSRCHTCRLHSGLAASNHSQHAIAAFIVVSVKCSTGVQHSAWSNRLFSSENVSPIIFLIHLSQNKLCRRSDGRLYTCLYLSKLILT